MVLLSAAIVFAGLGWLGLGDSDDSAPAGVAASSTVAPPPAAEADADGAHSQDQAADADTDADAAASDAPSASASATPSANSAAVLAVPVRVYNNSTVEGLAATAADDLRAEGWNVTEVSNYGEGQIPKSTVYYGAAPGEKEAAEKVAREMGISAEARFEGIADAPPGVIVILTGPS